MASTASSLVWAVFASQKLYVLSYLCISEIQYVLLLFKKAIADVLLNYCILCISEMFNHF